MPVYVDIIYVITNKHLNANFKMPLFEDTKKPSTLVRMVVCSEGDPHIVV